MERSTRQRKVIQDVFLVASAPLSPQDVLKQARLKHKKLGIATVYRTINSLVKEGMLKAIRLPGESTRYEVRGKRHHHFFRCHVCRKIFEINTCPGNLNKLLPPGFIASAHDLFLYGRCAACVRS